VRGYESAIDASVALASDRGHAHFWERAALSRRQFIGGVGAAGLAVGGTVLTPMVGRAAPATGSSSPKPIPQTLDTTPFHLQLPGHGAEPSVITDFKGRIGVALTKGTGHDSDATPGLTFETDVRFMSGHFVGQDQKVHRGGFGFV
jgi:hypothetical protein